ncbi:MAG: cupin domain-containing protein [Anaerolineae bacterium]|nr:cupin domain-containing protein [Anaerolineae bacterium]MCO5189784.1 cupin domain-containing protein [Anaerolineae bacterium]MCO5196453.1 cupin domain-containing protein [Anaerolineae bacterium]
MMDTPQHPNLFVPDLADLLPETGDQTIVSKRVYQDDKVTTILFSFAPGEELSEHTSAFPAILHFLSGSADITLGDDTHRVTAGAWTHMPSHLPHSIRAVTPTTMLLIMLRGA